MTPGTFTWVELATTDQKGATAFYPALFGWELKEFPIGGGETYSMFVLDGRDVGAAYSMRDDERQMGLPSHWNLYVGVANADETVTRAQFLGATVLVAPFDVMDQGRMAVLQDPTGAVFHLWQGKQHAGVGAFGVPGALCWSELTTRDPKAAEEFYAALFSWVAKPSAPAAVMQYTEFSLNGQPFAGMMAMPAGMPAHVPSYWMPYFEVASLDASVSKAQGMGAKVMVPAQDIPDTGRFAIITDPQGAMLALFTRLGGA